MANQYRRKPPRARPGASSRSEALLCAFRGKCPRAPCPPRLRKGRAPFHAGSLCDPSPGGFCLGYHGHYSRVGMGGRGPRDLSGPPKRCLSSWEPWCQQLKYELCGPQQLLRHGLHSPACRPHERHQGATGEGGLSMGRPQGTVRGDAVCVRPTREKGQTVETHGSEPERPVLGHTPSKAIQL